MSMAVHRIGRLGSLRKNGRKFYICVFIFLGFAPIYFFFLWYTQRHVYTTTEYHQRVGELNQRSVTVGLLNHVNVTAPLARSQSQKQISRSKMTGKDKLKGWRDTKKVLCDGKFEGYAELVALFRDVIMDTSHAKGRPGGDNFSLLWNQAEKAEYYKFEPGFLAMTCAQLPVYTFTPRNHVKLWMDALVVDTAMETKQVDRRETTYWIGVTRYEYVNLYHTMTDWYGAFFVMTFFNLTRENTNILFIDGHPSGSLDSVWEVLFNSALRIGQLPQRTLFRNFVAGIMGYHSPLMKGTTLLRNKAPLFEEFREFFLSSYHLETDRALNCSRLSLLIIWRRPYLAHPRNPSGDVHRKVKNEDEITATLTRHYPHFTLRSIQADRLSMREQLKYTSESDVLIGMHGAGLTLSLMLPKHGALLEFMPNYVVPSFKSHFIAIAQKRGLIYRRWVNHNAGNEFADHFTRLPPDMVISNMDSIYNTMCPNRATKPA